MSVQTDPCPQQQANMCHTCHTTEMVNPAAAVDTWRLCDSRPDPGAHISVFQGPIYPPIQMPQILFARPASKLPKRLDQDGAV